MQPMLNRALATCLFVFAFQAPALATKYYLEDEKESAATVGNAEGRVIVGVLLKQDLSTYTIRIVGGEVTIAKSAVKRIENDGMTIAKIEKMEKDSATAVAASETQRREIQAAEASARRSAAESKSQPAKTEEQSILIEIDFQGLLPGYTFRTFDPVLGRANLTGLRAVIEDFLRREIKKAAHR